jgi:inner membrane protein
MDSLTQLVLGSAVSLAVMGRRTAAWKAGLWGAVAGTAPDLDALVDHGDAVLNMVLHRAQTHALPLLALASLPLGWAVARLHGESAQWRRWWLAMLLVLTTHAGLDAMTVYGTQLLQPFTDRAFGVDSIFIIDPAYTLPLLVGVLWAWGGWRGGRRANALGLALSTGYLAWSVLAQSAVLAQAQRSLASAGLPGTQVLVTPAPFSTVLWRVLALDGDRYHEGYYSLFDGGRPIRFASHPRGGDLLARHGSHPQVQRMLRFSEGFVRLREVDGQLWLTDLRMGQEPAYVFEFQLAPASPPGGPPVPAVRVGRRVDVASALPWLWARLRGADLPPFSEVVAQATPARSPGGPLARPLDPPIPHTTGPRLP